MSFSFGFADLDDEAAEVPPFTNPLDEYTVPEGCGPVEHSLESVLATLAGVRLLFERVRTAGGHEVCRRELFDIKHQLMAEDGEGLEREILLGDTNEDLRTNVYEGGLKSWECAYDTIDWLAARAEIRGRVVDLGCGTALPLAFLLGRLLASPNPHPVQLVLSDFNHLVLRLVSVPNLLIAWAATVPLQDLARLQTTEHEEMFRLLELLLTPAVLDAFVQGLAAANVSLSLVLGSWGREFVSLVRPGSVNLLVLSETIYSPPVLPVVAESVVELLAPQGTAAVAAKDLYFGVGGNVAEFVRYLHDRVQLGVPLGINTIKMNTSLQRSVVEVVKQ